jgi:hypothetical protein
VGEGADEDDGTADPDGAGEGEEEGGTAGTGAWETTEARETTEATEAAQAMELTRLPGVVDLHGRTMPAGAAHNRLFRGASVSVTSCPVTSSGYCDWLLRLGAAIGYCRNGDCSPVTC